MSGPSEDLLRAVAAARLFSGGVLLVAGRSHELSHDRELVGALLSAARVGVAEQSLVEHALPRWERSAVLGAISELLAVSALTRGKSEPAPGSFESFAVIPQQVGTWHGNWLVADPNGNILLRFTATLDNAIIGDRWCNELEQQQPDGSTIRQEFVGEVIAPGLVDLKSVTPQMSGYQLLVREVAETYLLIEVVHRATQTLFGVEVVTLEAPHRRVRTMQTFTQDGRLQSVVTILEQRTQLR